jgi:AcrR family transcriptional regulator
MTGQAPGEAFDAARRADRPRRHTGNSELEGTILEASERLLARIALSEVSVADILSESGVSRATFYFYFSSKYAVVTSLLTRLYGEMFGLVSPYVDEQGNDPESALRASLTAAAAFWKQHSAALRAVHEHWPMVPELQAAWLEILERYTGAVAKRIARDRKAGVAASGPDCRQLAAALLWGSDRCLYVAGLGLDKDLPTEADAIEPLVRMWVGAIYGRA